MSRLWQIAGCRGWTFSLSEGWMDRSAGRHTPPPGIAKSVRVVSGEVSWRLAPLWDVLLRWTSVTQVMEPQREAEYHRTRL